MSLGAAAGRRLPPLRLVAACLALAAAVAGLHVIRPALLARIDLAVYDRLLAAAAPRPPSERLALVDIDERSLTAVGRWPWSRDRLARLVDRLHVMGAAAIGLDIIFAEPDAADGEDPAPSSAGRLAAPVGSAASPANRDAALAAVLRESPAVIGFAFTFGPAVDRPCHLERIGLARDAETPPGAGGLGVPRATGVVCSLVPLARAARASGFLNAAPDADGVLRRMPQLVEFRGDLYPSLALATIRTALAARQLAVVDPPKGRPILWLDQRVFPLEEDGSVLLRFRGPPDAFRRISAVDVLAGDAPAGAVEGRIVFVGVSALGLGDRVATPLGAFLTGIDIHATLADNLLSGDFLRRPAGAAAAELGLGLVAALGVALGVAALGWAWSLPLALLGGVLLWLGAGWLLAARGLHVSPLFPTLALAGALGLAALHRLIAERRRADQSTRQLRTAREMMLHALTSLTETRDFETGAHLVRTSRYSRILGEALAARPKFRAFFTPETIDLVARLAPIHDIGKVGVADRTLRKPGPLSDDERAEMSRHPVYGRDVIARAEARVGVQDDFLLRLAKEIVYSHHERWDGTGYPEGLRGDQIPIAGRLVALVDVYDALSSARVYKGALPHDEVVQAIVAGRGTQFDPDMVDAFLEVREAWRRIAIEFADEHDEPAAAAVAEDPAPRAD
jgi:CHASE2 domain-containing sensor protein